MNKYQSISKPYLCEVNEDAVKVTNHCLAVSDGAGGCGILADRWSQFLVSQIPEIPLKNYNCFNNWIGSIWSIFFKSQEEELKSENNFVINKFYNEGSYATLVAAWITGNSVNWLAYGDSALMVYRKNTKSMEYISHPNPFVFLNNPMLINWKDKTSKKGFLHGELTLSTGDVLILATDAVSCYLTLTSMIYQRNASIDNFKGYKLDNIITSIKKSQITDSFEMDCLNPLLNALKSKDSFKVLMHRLFDEGQIVLDDYTLIVHQAN